MNFSKQFCALVFFAIFSLSLPVVADEETEEDVIMNLDFGAWRWYGTFDRTYGTSDGIIGFSAGKKT